MADGPEKSREEQLRESQESFRAQLAEAAQVDLDELRRKLKDADAGDESRFLEAAATVIAYARELSELAASFDSKQLLQEAQGDISTLYGSLQQIAALKPQQFHPSPGGGQAQWIGSRDQFLGHFERNGSGAPARVRGTIAYLRVQRWNEQELGRMTADCRRAREQAQADATEIQKVLAVVRDAPARITIAQFARHFSEAADGHKRGARGFLALATAFFFSALGYLFLVPLPDKVPEIVSRVLTLGLFYAGLHFAIGSYRSHMHLRTVSQHRANVLSTCDLLLQSAQSDGDTRQAMLREAATCIFQFGPSGFIGEKDMRLDQQMFELMRDFITKKST